MTISAETFPPTGGPSFAVEGKQYLIGGKGGEGILANCASGLCDKIGANGLTFFENFGRTGSYDYLGDPSPVPLPASLFLLLGAIGFLAAWRAKA